MKELLILSGKGGTGKTTVASSFIKLSNAKVYADCDVEAPNLHLLKGQNIVPKLTDYCGLPKAVVNKNLCTGCGKCKTVCRYNAVTIINENGKSYSRINPFACEGCSVCKEFCTADAITLEDNVAGKVKLFETESETFSTAKLNIGGGVSGKLVSEVKKQMRENPKPTEIAVIDGSPGIGCPVIASLSGVDMVLIVAEPSMSGISDMERIIKTAGIFKTKTIVCVNKYNTNIENTNKIESFCKEKGIPFVGKIPYDTEAVKAINNGKTIVDVDCISGTAVKEIYKNTIQLLLD